MVYQEIDEAMIKRVCEKLEFYDKHKKLPHKKVRVDITLPLELIQKTKNLGLKKKKTFSKIVEESLIKYILS